MAVFLSHNSGDKSTVRQIAEDLEGQGLKVWFDEWELQPGRPWQPEVEKALESSEAVVVFLGPHGLGPWEKPEMQVALEQQVRRKIPVIPLILPGAPDNDAIQGKLPALLRVNTWVDFRSGLNNPEANAKLYWGITGKNPARKHRQPEPEAQSLPAIEATAVDSAIAKLGALLRAGNVTYFLGKGVSKGDTNFPPSDHEITRNLLTALELIEPRYDQLLPPVDVAASYYAIREGEPNLEQKVVDLIVERSRAIPSVHQQLAKLMGVLKKRPEKRLRRKTSQLIITTNFDVMLERALLQSGVSFTRIVQHRSASRTEINEYRGVTLLADNEIQLLSDDGDPITVKPHDFEELDEIIRNHGQRTGDFGLGESVGRGGSLQDSLSLKDLTEPILYKFHGSQDIANSCTISIDQYFDFVWKLLKKECIPTQISEIISNTPILFLGCGILDPDFRLTYHTLLRKPLETSDRRANPRYALQLPPEMEADDTYRKMELRIWSNIKTETSVNFGITLLEEGGDTFIEKLIQQVRAYIRGV